jgi:hypothetical protein
MSALLIATLCGLVLSRMPAAAAVYVPAENSYQPSLTQTHAGDSRIG